MFPAPFDRAFHEKGRFVDVLEAVTSEELFMDVALTGQLFIASNGTRAYPLHQCRRLESGDSETSRTRTRIPSIRLEAGLLDFAYY